jgi:hypothetical protein
MYIRGASGPGSGKKLASNMEHLQALCFAWPQLRKHVTPSICDSLAAACLLLAA